MIDIFSNYLSFISMIIGLSFCTVGVIGLFSMPDLYAKQHALGLIDTGGYLFIIIALLLKSGLSLISLKLILLGLLSTFLSAPICNALIKASIICKIIPKKIHKE